MDTEATVEPVEQARAWLAEYGGPRVCAAELLCDRHRAEWVALVCEDAAGREERLTFGELRERSARLAGVLRGLGVGRGDRVATLLPRRPELAITTLALWRLGAVHVPLFTAFGPQAVAYRLDDCAAKVVVTDAANRPKIGAAPGRCVVAVEGPGPDGRPGHAGDTAFWAALDRGDPVEEPARLSGDDPLILIYTSGTTGLPKGVEVPLKALASLEAYMRFGLDVRPEDVFWNVGDPGWGYGLFYALVGPWLIGHATLLVDAPFSAEATYRVLAEHAVTNFAAAPTVYRALRAAGAPALPGPLRLRAASSAGEPLNPDVVAWAERHLGVAIRDHYGQTEQGMFVNNHHAPGLARPLRPGSMGHPMPGFRPVVLDTAGREVGPGEEGQIALDREGSPLYWFRGYYRDAERTAERFTADGRYYLTGDAARRDADGYFYFAGRSDDLINYAGYRIGPFEVESALIGHPAVAEAAAVGKPDALRGEIVKAYVVLKPAYAASDELAEALGQFVKANLSAHAYPREIEFVEQLPKTASGKIQRSVLRARAREAVGVAR
jgi:acetyl-CoA synthetase